MHFVNTNHEQEFKRLQTLKAAANTTLDYADYCYAYYIFTADSVLLNLVKRFLDEQNGDIKWQLILESKIIHEDLRQVVAFAHQLYSGGWSNDKFVFVKMLDDLRGKPNLLDAVLEACRLYSQKACLRGV
ncbi:hypothetical protein SBF1_2500005 [Candidatus Desulfosporosinus infrequens]|uniref:Uncharacterized protein n=1 Tax=Candidatus Desulfosporosinus infrequens TaxID=2043169 RepID=A0A2U3KPC6_9FIRM|nr:hypothetical protein SBF1_2500005 [Candidatus Desulfosporosinus infrequens]